MSPDSRRSSGVVTIHLIYQACLCLEHDPSGPSISLHEVSWCLLALARILPFSISAVAMESYSLPSCASILVFCGWAPKPANPLYLRSPLQTQTCQLRQVLEGLQWESLQFQCFFSTAAPLRTAVGQPHSYENKPFGEKIHHHQIHHTVLVIITHTNITNVEESPVNDEKLILTKHGLRLEAVGLPERVASTTYSYSM